MSTFVMSEPESNELSIAQHEDLVFNMREAGATVLHVPLVPEKNDSVFIKDSAVLVSRQGSLVAFAANPKNPARQREQPHRISELKKIGFNVPDTARARFEGGDFVMLPSGLGALMGYGIRSDREPAVQLADFLRFPVTPLELTSPELFHLDLALAVTDDNTAFACKEGLSNDAWKTLLSLDHFKDVVEVSYDEALDFALNWVKIHKRIILGRRSPRLISMLEAKGFEVVVTKLEHFHQSNGGAACLVNEIHQL